MVAGQEGMGKLTGKRSEGYKGKGIRKGWGQRGNYKHEYFRSTFTGTAGRVFRH